MRQLLAHSYLLILNNYRFFLYFSLKVLKRPYSKLMVSKASTPLKPWKIMHKVPKRIMEKIENRDEN